MRQILWGQPTWAEGALDRTTTRLDIDAERELVGAQVSHLSELNPADRNAYIQEKGADFRPGTWIYVLRQLYSDPTSEDAFIDECWLVFLGVHPAIKRNEAIEVFVSRVTKAAVRVAPGDVERQSAFLQDLRVDFLLPVTQKREPQPDKWVLSFFIKLQFALREMVRLTLGDEIAGGMSNVPKSLKRRAKSRAAGSSEKDEKKDQKSVGDRYASSDDELGLPRSDEEWDRMIARALQRHQEPKEPDRLDWVDGVEPQHLIDERWNERSETWELREALLAAIRRLPLPERDAIVLFAQDVQVRRGAVGDTENVEDRMGISHTAFYTLKNSALKKLRNDPELRRAMVDEAAVRSKRPNPPEGTGTV
jgi:hypothetical protein